VGCFWVPGEGSLGASPLVRIDIEWEASDGSVNGDSDQGVSVDIFRSVNTEGAKAGDEWTDEGGESHIEPAYSRNLLKANPASVPCHSEPLRPAVLTNSTRSVSKS
jgi:hypothetical protein